MSKSFKVLWQVLASLLALVLMFGTLLSIAYFRRLYTPPRIQEQPFLALIGATIMDASGSTPVKDATLVISGDRIWSVEQRGRAPMGAEIIHTPDTYIMPALIDAAVYFEAPAAEEVNYKAGEWFWEITRSTPEHRRSLQESGIAVVQDLGSGLDSILNTRSLLRQGKLAGPTLLTSGPILMTSESCLARERYPLRGVETTRVVLDPAEGANWVRALADRGVDAISICYRTTGENLADPGTLESMILTARALDLLTFVETSSADEARYAAEIGADALIGGVTQDGEEIESELFDILREKGTVYIPTLVAIEANDGNANVSLSTAMKNTRGVYQAGIPIVAGSGTAGGNIWFGASLHRELELLVAAGLSNMDALRAATINAATLLDFDDLGTINEGNLANLIILEGNPLEEIRALKRIQGIVINGELLEFQPSHSITAPTVE